MTDQHSSVDKGRLFGKVVYIFFCFYAMAVAQRFGMNLIYGAALYISLSAFVRMLRFTIKTTYDLRWLKIIKLALIVFFVLSSAYIFVMYPFLYRYPHAVYAIGIIVAPVAAQSAGVAARRGGGMSARARLWMRAGVALACVGVTAALIGLADGDMQLLPPLAVGMGLDLLRRQRYRGDEYQRPESLRDDFRQIASARLYDGMVITSGVALNAFMFTYVLYMMLKHEESFTLNVFVTFALMTLVCALIFFGTYRFVRKPLVNRIGKNAAFVLGTGIAIFAVYVFRDSWYGDGLAISLQTLLVMFGLTLQMSASIDLREDILMVVRLQNRDVNAAALVKRTQRQEHWTAVISEVVCLSALCVLISDPLIYAMDFDSYIALAPQIGSSLIAIPTAFLIMALVYSLRQPLTKKYDSRLKSYARSRETGRDNPAMEKRLTSVLIKRYKKRIGVHVIRMLLRPVMVHTVEGRGHVGALPGIFVFNHREFYGPIAAVVFLPYDMRPWILDKMIDKAQITAHMYEGTFSHMRGLPVWARRALARLLSPVVVWALSSFDPIPVHRGTGRGLLRTFELSVECLQAGDSLLIFPENPEDRYTDSEKVSDFYRGFANLGRLYYKRTKECATFYPVYASHRTRTLRIGEGVRYDPDNGRREEARIVGELQRRMRELQAREDER